MLMNVCKMKEWGSVHKIAPILQDHFNAAASKAIHCPDTIALVRNAQRILISLHKNLEIAICRIVLTL